MKDSNRKFVILLRGLILVLAALFINDFVGQRNSNRNYVLNNFNKNLNVQINYLNSKFEEYFNILDMESENHWPFLERIEQHEKVFAFVYKHDSLLYWNTSSVHFQLSSLKNRTILFIINLLRNMLIHGSLTTKISKFPVYSARRLMKSILIAIKSTI